MRLCGDFCCVAPSFATVSLPFWPLCHLMRAVADLRFTIFYDDMHRIKNKGILCFNSVKRRNILDCEWHFFNRFWWVCIKKDSYWCPAHRNQKYKARQEGYRNVKKGNIYPVSTIYNKKIKDFWCFFLKILLFICMFQDFCVSLHRNIISLVRR